jgi:hypothetical protein
MPGPYFIGQLLAANLSLRNDSHTTYTLSGPSRLPDPWVDGICGTVIFLTISGGSGPQYVPPVPLASAVPACPYGDFPLAPGQTLTVHKFVPVPNTGELTLQSGAYFTQTVTSPDGSHSIMAGHSPLDGRWPSITITVAATPPPDRQITLQRTGTQVQISAPTAARAHLYSIDAVTCNAVHGGPAGVGSIGWKPIATTVMPELTCGDSGTQVTQWWYVVSAPGYAIASGHAGP